VLTVVDTTDTRVRRIRLDWDDTEPVGDTELTDSAGHLDDADSTDEPSDDTSNAN